jgi:hypothetical protein
MKKTFLASMLVLPFLLPLSADTQVSLSASPQSARIGDRIEIHVIVKTAPDVQDIAVNGDLRDFDIIEQKTLPVRNFPDYRIFEKIITIAVFKIGESTVGPFEVVPVKDKKPGEKVKSGTLSIKINSVLEESDKDIKPLKKLMEMRGHPWFLLRYLIIPLILLLMAWIVVLILKERKKILAARAGPLPAPEEELAVSIRELAGRGLLEKGKAKELFIRLTGIFRRFFDRYYGFEADDLTTGETLLQLHRTEKEARVAEEIEHILVISDLVKFARFIPEAKTVDDLFAAIDRLIHVYRARRAAAQTEAHAAAGR